MTDAQLLLGVFIGTCIWLALKVLVRIIEILLEQEGG